MTYEPSDVTRRKTEANEYWNTKTEKWEVISRHGLYDVQETFLTPEGKILFLAFNAHAAQPYAVGFYNSDQAVYWTDGDDARRHYAWKIAESFDLIVDKKGSKAVVPASRDYATDLCEQIKTHAEDYQQAVTEQDEFRQEAAAEKLETSASSLAKHLQRTGVLTREVYNHSERIG
ncbi:hypothetical protein [Streptomyces sp. NBC_01451]|uniref:hypothetical protein n=1 Tax=Streptomyces sp. NBC_01451 TaxID=2903872 RepID=UPI002E325865|nr:hypothetical protein [Streptomyces sp. NBC_01451]